VYTLQTKLNTGSTEFRRNREDFLKILQNYKDIYQEVSRGGSDTAVKKHKGRGKLLARERIDLLVDPDTPFLELSPLASWDQYDNQFPSAGIVTGIGIVHGREVVIIALSPLAG
jgi:acetyl-CoA carboxylase carboxyltransferase component